MSTRVLFGAGAALVVAIGLNLVGQQGLPAAGVPERGAAVAGAAPASAAGGARSGERMALSVNEMGMLRPFRNGDQVLTSGPFALRIRFDPYPPSGGADLDITVVDAEDERPIADAAVSLRWEMPGHGHGVTPVRVPQRGDGHYGTRVNFSMGGDWTVDVDVRRGGQRGVLQMIVSTSGR